MDKRRSACCLQRPKIPFCCSNHVTKLGNITVSANAAASLTLTNHMAIRCLQVKCPFKKRNYFYFQLQETIFESVWGVSTFEWKLKKENN